MRLLLLTSSYPTPTQPTASAYLRDSVSAMTARGHTVTVVAPGDQQSPRSITRRDGREEVSFVEYMPSPHWQTLAYGAGMYDNVLRNPLRLAQLPPLLYALYTEAQRLAASADLIHAHWLFPSGLIGALMKRETGKPLVVTIHSTDYHLLRSVPGGRSLARAIVRRADRLHFVTEYYRERFSGWLGVAGHPALESAYVYPMGVADEMATSPMRPLAAHPRVGFLGRLIRMKGVDRLLHACAAIGHARISIAGAGPDHVELRRLARTVAPAAEFVGPVSGSAKMTFLDSCDVLVFPSRTYESGRCEGIPVSLLEALARGRVVVTSDSGGIPDVVKHGRNGYVFSAHGTCSLVDVLRHIVTSWPDTGHVAAAARETGRLFTSSAAVSIHERSYSSILGARLTTEEAAC